MIGLRAVTWHLAPLLLLVFAAGCANPQLRREDPLFEERTPLLFAHRGGARERPESTPLALRYALEETGTDVLEIDVQVTAAAVGEEEQFVVWHGPDLGNVRIEGRPSRPEQRHRRGDEIDELRWSELDGRAWVADFAEEHPTVSDVPRDPERRLLLLSEMLAMFPEAAINIELKESFKKQHVPELIGILRENHGERKILVVSTSWRVMRAFRKEDGGRDFLTGLSAVEAVLSYARGLLPFAGVPQGRAVQIPHQRVFSSERYIRKLQDAGSSVHVFITGFFCPGLDADGPPDKEKIFGILDRGVDGIMTDRPRAVRLIMDEWIAERKLESKGKGAISGCIHVNPK